MRFGLWDLSCGGHWIGCLRMIVVRMPLKFLPDAWRLTAIAQPSLALLLLNAAGISRGRERALFLFQSGRNAVVFIVGVSGKFHIDDC